MSGGLREAAGEGEDRYLGRGKKGKLGVVSAGTGKPRPHSFLSTQKGVELFTHSGTEAPVTLRAAQHPQSEAHQVPERKDLSHLTSQESLYECI